MLNKKQYEAPSVQLLTMQEGDVIRMSVSINVKEQINWSNDTWSNG